MLNPDTVLVAGVAVLRSDRLPSEADRDRYGQIPPDFAVYDGSPTDRWTEIEDKIRRYQAAGVPLLWYVARAQRTVTVYALGREPVVLGMDDVLGEGEVFPGFTLPVADVFA